ncbi:MAG TPA: PilZ domain-containing protein [Anaeromyxobacteraceae bacterium]|nr:PilZ domain-containing protein [Anaeromyxobacteraceae bacterium]
MDLGHWLTELKALHEKARSGTLGPTEQREYRSRRAELARALLAAQSLTRQPGQSARQSLRVARALQVELSGAGRSERLTTFDISAGGFAAPMGSAPETGAMLTASIRLPGTDPLVTPVKVVGSVPMVGYSRVSFSFGRLDPASAERLDLAILDMVLQQLGPVRTPPAS